jgi:hypothetical protein
MTAGAKVADRERAREAGRTFEAFIPGAGVVLARGDEREVLRALVSRCAVLELPIDSVSGQFDPDGAFFRLPGGMPVRVLETQSSEDARLFGGLPAGEPSAGRLGKIAVERGELYALGVAAATIDHLRTMLSGRRVGG